VEGRQPRRGAFTVYVVAAATAGEMGNHYLGANQSRLGVCLLGFPGNGCACLAKRFMDATGSAVLGPGTSYRGLRFR
jgi:hypothetical protein